MQWPWVSRLRLEALEDKTDALLRAEHKRYEQLEQVYEELKAHADDLLAQVLGEQRKEKELVSLEPEKPQTPRRPLRRDIVAAANEDAAKRYKKLQGTP